jgi:alkylation response protein AidB-like acyl-CoA dehydrogenase
MDETLTEEGFAEEALAFLRANASPRPPQRVAFGEGSDEVALFAERTREEEAEEVSRAKQWATKVFDAGFGWITGPSRYGGRELPASFQRRYAALEGQFETPSQACRGIGLGMIAPTILAHGTDSARERYMRALHRGDMIACQLFSEPGSGSDLASLQTRAVRDGDEWRITGQKVWTSGAQYSDIGEIICRTNADVEKHRGLTGFIVDMHAPGVEVRPLRQMTGGASFNEVFLEDVRVPADHLLGDVDQGWTVALTTLMNERAAIGGGGGGLASGSSLLQRLLTVARQLDRTDDPMVRQQLAGLYISLQVAKFTNDRALAKIRAGQLPGPELSIAKLALTNNMQQMSSAVAAVLGLRLVADAGGWGTYAWSRFVLGVPGMRVAGGSDEIMRNIIGERVLGLPKDP